MELKHWAGAQIWESRKSSASSLNWFYNLQQKMTSDLIINHVGKAFSLFEDQWNIMLLYYVAQDERSGHNAPWCSAATPLRQRYKAEQDCFISHIDVAQCVHVLACLAFQWLLQSSHSVFWINFSSAAVWQYHVVILRRDRGSNRNRHEEEEVLSNAVLCFPLCVCVFVHPLLTVSVKYSHWESSWISWWRPANKKNN